MKSKIRVALLTLCLLPATVFAIYYLLWGIALLDRPSRIAQSFNVRHGIEYQKIIWEKPRDVVWHILLIDVEKYEIITTAKNADSELDTLATTTSNFAKTYNTVVAVNGSYFEPFHMNHYFDFYPREGDPVNILGRCKSQGKVFSNDHPEFPVLSYNGERVSIFEGDIPNEEVAYLAGHQVLVRDQVNVWDSKLDENLYPRVAVGTLDQGKTLCILVVDGKQRGYSAGVTFSELADMLVLQGVQHGIALDGGGSTTLVIQNESGELYTANAPYHTRFPMRERPVANHLGIRMKRN